MESNNLSGDLDFFVDTNNPFHNHLHTESVDQSLSADATRDDIETMSGTTATIADYKQQQLHLQKQQQYHHQHQQNQRHHHPSRRRTYHQSDRNIFGMTLRSSFHELDEAIASVKNVCLSSSRRAHNEEDYSIGSTIQSTLDGQSHLTSNRHFIDNLHDMNVASRTSFGQHSRPSSRAGRSITSSSKRSRVSRRKERKLERIVRTTILSQTFDFDSDSFSTEIHPTGSRDTGCSSKYSTRDILKDLMTINTVLTNEMKTKNWDGHTLGSSSSCFDDNRKLRSALSVNGRTTTMQQQATDPLSVKHRNDRQALLSSDDADDATWIEARIAEPTWARSDHEDDFIATTEVQPSSHHETNGRNDEEWTPWCQPNSFDDWRFEELEFPNLTASSTAALTRSTKSSAPGTRSKDVDPQTQPKGLDSKLSSESDGWPSFTTTPVIRRDINDDVSHQSPSSVLDYDVSASLLKETTQNKQNCSAWQRRLSRTRAATRQLR